MMNKKAKIGTVVAALSLVALFGALPAFKSLGSDNVDVSGQAKAATSVQEKEVIKLVDQAKDEEKNVVDPTDTFPYDDVVLNSENMYYIDAPGTVENEDYVEPDFFKDPAIRRKAKEYKNKGMYLTDAEKDAKQCGSGIGVGAFVFIKGFAAVDDIEGNNTCFDAVVKATPDEFKSFIKHFNYDLKVSKKGSVTTATFKDDMNLFKITYDKDTEVLEYVNEFLMKGIG